MRAIFAVLLLANVLLAVFHWLSPPREVAQRKPPTLSSDAPRLQLLGYANGSLPVEESTDRAETSDPVVASERRPLCEWVGPFAEAGEAEALQQRLQALDVRADIRDLEVSDGQGYWVHLPPELSQKAALQKLHELQAKQIDSYVIPRGELENGISFGMFSRAELARARRDDLVEQGYGAEILEIDRTHRETWLSMPAGEARTLSSELWDELLTGSSSLERRQNFCSGVASG